MWRRSVLMDVTSLVDVAVAVFILLTCDAAVLETNLSVVINAIANVRLPSDMVESACR